MAEEISIHDLQAMYRAMPALMDRLAMLEAAAHHAAAAAPQPATRTPPAAKPPKPDTFSGNSKDPTHARAWVAQVDNYFSAVSEPEASRQSFAVALLREHALLWWVQLPVNERASTWPEFSAALLAYFVPRSASTTARDAMAKLQQRGSVRAYTAEFKKLLLQIPDIGEADKRDRYCRGLKEKVRLQVAFAGPSTFEEMCSIADQIDSIIYANVSSADRSYGASPLDISSSGPVPMDIGAISERPSYADTARIKKLTDSERAKLRESGGCFYCRKPGHRALQCPLRKKAPTRA